MKSLSHRPAALCGLALLALTPIARAADAAAQPVTVAQADLSAQPVVVTATRLPQPVAQTLADVRVIDAQQIRNAGAMSLTEVLQLHGGAEISSNGGAGQNSSVFLRGTNSNHVVVLVDGVRIGNVSDGTTAFEHLPLNQIDRIEVLRGPASSLYGADAIGGVIQIFTKQGEHTSARVGLGSQQTREASASVGRRFGDTSVSLRAGYEKTDGINATNPASGFYYNPDRDGYRNANLGATVAHDWAAGHTLTARAWGSEGLARFDNGLGSTDDRTKRRLSGLSLESSDKLSTTWRSLLRLARGTDHYRTEGSSPSLFRTDQDQFTWQNDVTLPLGALAAGVEWRRERLDSSTRYTQDERILRSVFGSYALTQGAHQVEASLRHDDDSQFGGHNTGRLGYGFQLAPAWRLSAAAGTAFKTPTFNQLYWPLSFGFQGNPNLRPERARNVELAARYDDGALRGGLTLFQNRVRDLIASTPDFSTVVNVNRARIRGATLDAGYVTRLWSARAEWTQQSPENADNGLQLNRRARHFGSASFDWTPGAWRAGAEIVGSGERFNDVANLTRLGGYALLNLRAAYALTPEWSLSARVNNVADKRYELAYGYNRPGREVFVALEYAAK
ncbi:TonB-dependent receptor domain-containing protein [Azohydromonas caseinilytica]|uniref:TonB-dependent receptor n=1 Tax=Azohydromonas caseinilytica TaxID=2728836 RepID=A0A848F8U9_9BURK|nr:TonB-dependent receptor [Azohydromonas caseinilytica]NML14929.1 TonB-dependent receptor [Azohydromonas caseinilytica]